MKFALAPAHDYNRFLILTSIVKLLGVTFDKHLLLIYCIFPTSALHPTSISVLSAIFAFFLDSETSKTIACAVVGSRLDYVDSILTGISSRNIHSLQRVQNSLAQVVTLSTTNTTSALK